MFALLSPLLSFLGGPVISGLVDAYKLKLAAVNTADAHAIDLAKADLLAQIEARKEAVALSGNRLAALIQSMLGLIVVLYIGKVVVWDTMLGLGSTPAIHGDVATWMNMIIGFFMGGQIVSGVVNTVARRFIK